jgi:tetratricopeptide (TPR) repeat protein/transcriptional regulator with XRE-family HTH domain
MIRKPDDQARVTVLSDAALVQTPGELAALLRALRRRHARRRGDSELTYQAMASRIGCSQTAIAEYFTARTIPPTDRFDALTGLLGASPAERGALATARDRVDEHRRKDHRQAPGAGSPGRPGHGVPRQLPTALRHFCGRSGELAELDRLLDEALATQAVLVTAISGTAGVGKTTLAVHYAHRVAQRFPDGQLYVNLRGFGANGAMMEPAEAMHRFLDALGVSPERIPADLDAQAALYRSHLAGRRMLLVLDNARDSAQVLPLLPGTPGCFVLVTSRSQLTGLIAAAGAHPLTLDLLTGDEARLLLSRRLGTDRVDAEPAAVTEIIGRCARLPLALALMAARAAVRPAVALRLLADELGDTRQRWQALANDDPAGDVRAVLSWSYQALTPAAARLFRLLGLHPGQDTDALAAASLAGLAVDAARPLLTELTKAGLLVQHAPGRYTFHDLLRDYAADLTRTIDPEQERRAATARLLDHYLHSAHPAALLLAPPHDPLTLGPAQPGVTPERHTGKEQAMRWFNVEYRGLLAAIGHAAATGYDTHAWQLTWTVATFLDRQGHWHDYAAAGRCAVAAADRLGDPVAAAWARRTLARAYTRLNRFDDADQTLADALGLSERSADLTGQADAQHYLAILCWRSNRLEAALRHARQYLDLSRAVGHRGREAAALNGVGWFQALLGDPEPALASCGQALVIYTDLGDPHGLAHTWDSLGYAHHQLGHHGRAIACYRNTLTLVRSLGDRYQEADTLANLGGVHLATGDPGAAQDAWQRALAILVELDHPDAERVRARLAGLGRQG